MKIEIVIPNYKGLNLIKENLPKIILAILDYNNCSITIVDDGSSSEEFLNLKEFIDQIQKKHEIKINLLRNKKNLGFSSTVNNGAASTNADFIVFLNTDIVPEKNFLDAALNDLQADKNLFGVGFMDKSIEESGTILRGRGTGGWSKGFFIHSKGALNKNNTLWISGGSSIIRRELFEKIGGFDTLFNPFYWEDIDLSYRAQKLGYKILFEKESIVIHKHAKGAIRTNFDEFKISSIAYRNQVIFIWKNITDLDLIFSHIIWLPVNFIKALLRFDIPFFYGFILAFVKVPIILRKRRRQMRMFKKTDKEILNEYIE